MPRSLPKPHTPDEVPTDRPGAENAPAGKTATRSAPPSRSSVREHADFVAGELDKGRNAVAIYQDLVEHRAYTGSYDAVKRFARRISFSPTLLENVATSLPPSAKSRCLLSTISECGNFQQVLPKTCLRS